MGSRSSSLPAPNPIKSTIAMDDVWQELPPELINEVLLRLPVRSIGRFRCVSKPWRSHLSSPKFAKSHRNLAVSKPWRTPSAVLLNDPDLITFPADGDGTNGRAGEVMLDLIQDIDTEMTLMGTCHGFVLLIHEHLHVFNPVTFESITLPFPEVIERNDIVAYMMGNRCYGMGYDSGTDDYKIVQLLHHRSVEFTFVNVTEGTFVNVYSLRMKSWKRVAKAPYNCFEQQDSEGFFHHPGVYLNGFLHWVARDKNDKYVIAAFSLAREVFEEILLPGGFGDDGKIMQVAVLRGCLAIMGKIDGSIVVWLMNEYGVQESWEKLVINTRQKWSWRRRAAVLFLSSEDELFFLEFVHKSEDEWLELDKYIMVAYSLTSQIWRDIVVENIRDFYECNPLIFTECLLSPEHAADQTKDA